MILIRKIPNSFVFEKELLNHKGIALAKHHDNLYEAVRILRGADNLSTTDRDQLASWLTELHIENNYGVIIVTRENFTKLDVSSNIDFSYFNQCIDRLENDEQIPAYENEKLKSMLNALITAAAAKNKSDRERKEYKRKKPIEAKQHRDPVETRSRYLSYDFSIAEHEVKTGLVWEKAARAVLYPIYGKDKFQSKRSAILKARGKHIDECANTYWEKICIMHPETKVRYDNLDAAEKKLLLNKLHRICSIDYRRKKMSLVGGIPYEDAENHDPERDLIALPLFDDSLPEGWLEVEKAIRPINITSK